MRRALAFVLVSLAGCGSSSDSTPPLFGGFTPASGAAAILAPATCNVPFLGTTGVSGVLIELTSRGDACAVLTAAQQCGGGASSSTVLIGAFSGSVGGSVGPAGPGTYPFLANPPTGAFLASIAEAAQLDASCAAPGGATDQDGGSITLTEVTASKVTGSTDLHFDNGQELQIGFDVAVCPVSISTCSLFSPCLSYVCVP